MQCPECGEIAPDEARFCESCGKPLTAPPPPPVADATLGRCRCGAGPEAVDSQGFCTECGRHRGPQARDHAEITLAMHFGAVTDKGLRHPRNEDDVALAIEQNSAGQPAYVIVVCDGVSSSQYPDSASAAAATSARDRLAQAAREGSPEPEAAMSEAIRVAHEAVCDIHYTPGGLKDPPATTIVAACVQGEKAVVGWIGDSRAYWLTTDAIQQLTHDDSWINQVVDAGEMSEEEALHAPEAHAITRCLGRIEGADDPTALDDPSVRVVELHAPGRLLLCSDGLWNYAPHPEDILALVHQSPADADVVTLSRHLVEFAIAQGGKDNITVAILSL